MQWETSQSQSGQKEYILWHKNDKVLTLHFHPATNAARVESAREKRVFQIRKEGFLKSKTVMRNEYGVLIGQVRHENKENTIEMENERFFYFTRKRQLSEIIVYKESKEEPVAVCTLNIEALNFSKDNSLPGKLESGLLLSLCWYLENRKVKERESALAM